MMNSKRRFLSLFSTLVVLCFAQFVAESVACSCVSGSPEDIFCGSHWVARVLVEARNEDENQRFQIRYTFRFIRLFKIDKNVPVTEGNEAYVYTASMGSLCGLPTLKPGHEYLLNGIYHGGRLSVHLCGQLIPYGSNNEWHRVSQSFRDDLELHAFDEHCAKYAGQQ